MKTKNKILSCLLAVVMILSFALPTFAFGVEITDGTEIAAGEEEMPLNQTGNEEPEDKDGSFSLPYAPALPDIGEDAEHFAFAAENENFLLSCTPEQAAKIIVFYEFAKSQIARGSGFQLFASPGDGGTVTWTWGETVGIDVPSGDPDNPYHIGNIPSITLTTANPPVGRPFCAEFGPNPGGSYTASVGSNNQILSLLVAHQEGSASAAGVQLALWYVLDGIPLSSHPQAAAALSAAGSIDTTGYTYLIWNSGSGQPFVTLEKASPDDPDDPDDPENPNTRTEVTTKSDIRTDVRSNTTYEYSDAIGQITICKRDNNGVSLDGAIFNIQIQFANGQTGGDSAFEVYNGSRVFTYTHPKDDHEPAKITVTEVRPPHGYTGDSTPQTATIHPTYTRVTKVTTHTITVTTTTTTTSVIDIDSGRVLSESSASADAETELNPPVVQEYTDFIEGDREITLTYVNTPKPGSLTIYKYEKGSYNTPLAGARFRIRYVDISVSAQVWECTTGADGKIIIDPLPFAGTLVIEELEAPDGYEIEEQSTYTITVSRGEEKQLDVPNKRQVSLVVYKKDAITDEPIQGVRFRLTKVSGEPVGEYMTDGGGVIVVSGLEPGWYTVLETATTPGYVLDKQPRTVEIKAGKTSEIVWENQPARGRIVILKKSNAENPITKQKSGAVLEGAVFEVYDKDLNLVDTITTDSRGIATTIDLPLGTYALKEVKAPEYFFTEGKVFYAEIKLHGDVVKFEVLNTPADISVTVEKRGNVEVVVGDEMRYDFSSIANTGNISLNDFFWHDVLPADAVRIKTIHTGTWSESLTYSVTYRTNLKSAYRALASNLTSRQNHMLDCTPAKLNLAANEYITDIRFEFGTVQPGFSEVDAPGFVVNTLAILPDGYRIVNRTDVGGRSQSGGKWVTAHDTWITVVLGRPKGDLPKTGWE